MDSSGYSSFGGGGANVNQRIMNLGNSATFSRTNVQPIFNTPTHHQRQFNKHETMTFSSVGMTVLLKTDYRTVSNRKFFSQSGGLGANKGSPEWEEARLKKERMEAYVLNI